MEGLFPCASVVTILRGFFFSSFPSLFQLSDGKGLRIQQFFLFFFFFCLFWGLVLHPWHMEVSRLGVKLELQLLAYATSMATPDWSCICELHGSFQHCRILNPLSEASDRAHILMYTMLGS